jgi:hypothetical protein
MGAKKQFSLARAALITGGREKRNAYRFSKRIWPPPPYLPYNLRVADIDKDAQKSDISCHYAYANPARQKVPDRETNPGPDVADKTHGNPATDAATHLERSGYTLQSLCGDPQEIEHQAACLIDWARAKGLVLPHDYTVHLFRHNSSTAEHQVFYRQADNRAVKLTHPGTFGATPDPKGAQRAATPLFYLHRLLLMNQVFDAGLRLEGIMLGKSLIIGVQGEQPSIATSQPWIRPADPQRPHPTNAEISEFMESLGFVQITRSYYGWHRKADAVIILDARPDNFISSPEGVVPIDLVISQAAPTAPVLVGQTSPVPKS